MTCPARVPPPAASSTPDPIYRSLLVTQIVNKILQRGKRSMAEKIVYDALEHHRDEDRRRPVATLKRAVDNVKPQLEVQAAGASVVPPTRCPSRSGPVGPTPSPSAGSSATRRQRRERTMAERLANELLDASNGVGASVKRKEDLQKMAESNKAFAHYRW